MAETGKLLYPSTLESHIDARIAYMLNNNYLDDVEIALLERLKILVANGQIESFIDFNDLGSLINYNSDLTMYLGGELLTPSEFKSLNNCIIDNQSITRRVTGLHQEILPYVDYSKHNIEFLSIGKNNTIWSNINTLFFNLWEPHYDGYREHGFDIVKLENTEVVIKSINNYPIKVGKLRTVSDGGNYNSNSFQVFSSNDGINWNLEYITNQDDFTSREHIMDFTAKYVKLYSLGNLLVPKDGLPWWDLKIGGPIEVNNYAQSYDFVTRDYTIDGEFPWNSYQFRTESTLAKLDNLCIENPQRITTTTKLSKGAELYITNGTLGYVNSCTETGLEINGNKQYSIIIHGSELSTYSKEVDDKEIVKITSSSNYNNSYNPDNLRYINNLSWRNSNLSDGGISPINDNVWLSFELLEPIELKSYTIKFNDQRKLPTSWKVMASLNGVNWSQIHYIDNYKVTPGILETFNITNKISKFKFFKIVFLKDSLVNNCVICSNEPNLTLLYIGLNKVEQESVFGKPIQSLFLETESKQLPLSEVSRKIYLPHKLLPINLFTGSTTVGYNPSDLLVDDNLSWKPQYNADRWFTIELAEKSPLYEIVFYSNDPKYNIQNDVEILGSNDNQVWTSLKTQKISIESEKISISNISKLVEYKFYKVKCLDKLIDLRYVELWNSSKESTPVIIVSYKKEEFITDKFNLKYYNSSNSRLNKIEGVMTKETRTIEEINRGEGE